MPHRITRTSSMITVSHGPSGGGALLAPRPERPFLEVEAEPRVVQADDPEVEVLPVLGGVVADLDPGDAGVALYGEDLARHLELLVRAEPLRLPHLADRREAAVRLLVGGGRVGRVLGEELGQHGGARRPPGLLVARE